MRFLYTIIFSVLLLSMHIFPQSSVGKLAGKVIDADTREPLIGANLIILNTNWGSATNIDGDYFILNIPPGTYDIKYSYVGYAPKTIQEVRIVSGVTYELNVELTTDFSLPEVVIEGRKFFEEKATNTKKVIDADEISRLPIRGVENIASLTAGVVIAEGSGGVDGNAIINVRGGRGGEVLYIVDGVPQNNVFTGRNNSQVSNSAIDQISFEIGGYEAKYGQAQSGIINVTTKSGNPKYGIFVDVLTSTFTDDYGYNLYTGNLTGPIIPGNPLHTFFLSVERGWFADGDPRAQKLEFPSIGTSFDRLNNNDASLYRISGRTKFGFGDWTVRLGTNINTRDYKGWIQSYSKNNSIHNTRNEDRNFSYTGRISQNVSASSFWNLNVGYRTFTTESGDNVWFDQLDLYGDSLANFNRLGVHLPSNGNRVVRDSVNVFFAFGRVNNFYGKSDFQTFNANLDFTAQIENHLFEVGGGVNYNIIRIFNINPVGLAADNLQVLPINERFRRMQPTVLGYDITGQTKTDTGDDITTFAPKKPILAYAYVQDRFELEDLVLNLGVRVDYFDTRTDILANPTLPHFAGDPTIFDAPDFVEKEAEIEFSPRIGLGFPLTASTVFHAQYGKFIQQPALNQLYTGIFDLDEILNDDARLLINGQVENEITTQYEIGFRQILGDNAAALNITAFYKNTEGLINRQVVFFQRIPGGEQLEYYTPTNTDFGTVKGLAISLDVSRTNYFSLSLDYTLSLAEGTGSSTSSNFVAAFRNTGPDRIPKVIAPLDFDQRHTGVINLDFYVPKGELGIFELLNANVLVFFNSGRPYTPLKEQNILENSSNWGETKGYVNSTYAPGSFRVDLKLEKGFLFGDLLVTPYLWIENLFDTQNPVTVYRSTGSPSTTAWLSTESGKAFSEGNPYPKEFVEDYKSLERNPFNFGIPQLIRLGLKVDFSNIEF